MVSNNGNNGNEYSNETRAIRVKDIKGIQQQNNFTNQILRTISSQLDRIEKNIPKTKETEKEKPLFKPSDCKKSLRLGGNKNNDDLIKILTKKLEFMNIKGPLTSKDQINFLSGSETGSSVSESLKNDSEQETEQINKIKTWHQRTKFFYPRPTPPDLQFEEKQPQINMFSNDFIYD